MVAELSIERDLTTTTTTTTTTTSAMQYAFFTMMVSTAAAHIIINIIFHRYRAKLAMAQCNSHPAQQPLVCTASVSSATTSVSQRRRHRNPTSTASSAATDNCDDVETLKTINSRMVRFFGPTPILVVKFLSRFFSCKKHCLR